MIDRRGRISTYTAMVTSASMTYDQIVRLKSRFDEWQLYTASIASNAYVYEPMMEWLNEATKTRKIKLTSWRDGVKRFYDGNVTTTIYVEGHAIKVKVERPDIGNRRVGPSEDMETLFSDFIVFRSRTQEGIDAVVRKLEQLTEERKKTLRNVYIYNPGAWGWDSSDFTYRDLDSVFLPEGVKEDLLADFDKFLASEEHYNRIGIPWHRGYLFEGAPGNGKSSLAAALAHRYKMNLYNLPLSSVKDDKQLMTLVSNMQDHSVLLLEDIDIFSKSMQREQKDGAPTLAGLLNALDGVATPHGMLTIMTTNHVEVLQDALVRPGRMDKRLELRAPVPYQIETMFRFAYDEELGVQPREFESMASLAEVFKTFTMDAESARMEIKGA